MKKANLVIFGSGRRVVSDILPVAEALASQVAITAICARRRRLLFGVNQTYTVRPYQEETTAISTATHVYLGVPPRVVPGLLAELLPLLPATATIILDTPVTYALPEGLGERPVVVAEDIVALPWLAVVPRPIHAVRAQYAVQRYHGVAFLKAVLDRPITGALGIAKWSWFFTGWSRPTRVRHPRQYDRGQLWFDTAAGVVSAQDITVLNSAGRITGFRYGDTVAELSEREQQLLYDCDASQSVVALTRALKRVGLCRQWQQLFTTGTGYSYDTAYADAALDAAVHGRLVGLAVRPR